MKHFKLSKHSSPQVEENGGAKNDGRQKFPLGTGEPRDHICCDFVEHSGGGQQKSCVSCHLCKPDTTFSGKQLQLVPGDPA